MKTDNSASKPASHNMERLMSQYQHADPMAAEALVDLLSPKFYRFFPADRVTHLKRKTCYRICGYAFTGRGTLIIRMSHCCLGCMR
jgi:hypothetical protein